VAGAGALASCAPAATPAPEAAPTCPPAEECPPCPTPAAAAEAGPVTLEVYGCSGSSEITELHAPRLDTLEGKTICEVANYAWAADRTFPLIESLLKNQFPTVKFVPFTEFGDIYGTTVEELEAIATAAKEKGCDAVITGNAG